MRLRARVDNNHKQIVEALRKCGFSVVSLHQVGKGVPDLLVGKGGSTWIVELKSKGGKLGDDQKKFIEEWRGSPVVVAYTFEEALASLTKTTYQTS